MTEKLKILLLCIWSCGGSSPSQPDIQIEDKGTFQDLAVATDHGSTNLGDALNYDTHADTSDGTPSDGTTEITTKEVKVIVSVDGEALADTLVMQGGSPKEWLTDENGEVTIEVDFTLPGDIFVMAIRSDTRVRGDFIYPTTESLSLELNRFDTSDNEDYVFKDPGVPGESHVIEKCAHCHLTIADTWYDSAHRTSAKNPVLHDLYSGTAASFNDEASCLEKGGIWEEGEEPGTGATMMQCRVATKVLALTQITKPGSHGNCADCHAPGIDGKIGERDLLDAEGYGFEYGVHCEVCHHVESVDMSGEPGVAGALKILRPSQPSPIPGIGEFYPLLFCPDPDVANPYMGCAPRPHFRESVFCAGCHELNQISFIPDAPVDANRWPNGTFPVHTTYSEWGGSSFAGILSCQGCHMPVADSEVSNSADLQFFGAANTGVAGGWPRPHGSVRNHSWSGPRSPGSQKLSNPLTLVIEKDLEGDTLNATVTVANSAAGHSMPTGDPLRSLLLKVVARCGDSELRAIGGDAIPDFGGSLALKAQGQDWNLWPDAQIGMIVSVVTKSGEYHDYEGYGAFGDGTFSAEEKGMPQEHVVGTAMIIAKTPDGNVTFDATLPEGDKAYLLKVDNDETLAGRSGFGFARVLRDQNGNRMVPHFAANDVASDNRLGPQQNWTSNHTFEKACEEPVVSATLIHRAYPFELAKERGWSMRDTVMIEESK